MLTYSSMPNFDHYLDEFLTLEMLVALFYANKVRQK